MLMGMEQQAELLPAAYLFFYVASTSSAGYHFVKMAKDPTQVRRVS